MRQQIDFISKNHQKTQRDYLKRVQEADKAACAEVAVRFDRDYWDGERRYGYGGYRYDGRWRSVAQEMARHYQLRPGSALLDVGCGKGFLLYELMQVIPQSRGVGLDISNYALSDSRSEVRSGMVQGTAARLPFKDQSFDFSLSILALHNLYNYDLFAALREMERVTRGPKYMVVESYRNEREKVNLLYWQLTCRSFYSTKEWEWVFEQSGYQGDYSFIFFE